MDDMAENLLFNVSPAASSVASSPESSVDGEVSPAAAVNSPPAAVLQTVNIKSHMPVVLALAEPNYDEWRCFMDAFLGKFGLTPHVSSPPTVLQRRDPDVPVVDQCILSRIYISIAKDGDMEITQYTGRLKQLADALHDVSQPVREMSQVQNMLRGLSSRYRHAIPAITTKQPPYTFLSARSYLLLEEHYDKEHAKTAAQQALLAAGAPRPPTSAPVDGGSISGSSSTPSAPMSMAVSSNSSSRNDNRRGHGRGRGRGGAPHGSSGSPGHNPWTSMVQAWPMPFRAPGAGVLGPRPGTAPRQAYFAGAAPQYTVAQPPSPQPPLDPWNHQALLTALNAPHTSPTGPQEAE
ncbi:unnamed protein product [Miscanthus lutarioriparius]|uniref:Uncharacterized protein n=1 Tax=Miscanthus lutarioriparius TaxID=422564 RepID=A0A811QYM9_9POAL|nr:unnamed protein product [Miscanthus lutarioriparius]